MSSPLFNSDGNSRTLAIPHYEYSPLKYDCEQMRFLVLQPCSEDRAHRANHVRCNLELEDISSNKPFTAIRNARGYRLLQEAIELDGKALLVSTAVESFLRHYRHPTEPVRLWMRYLCLDYANDDERQRYWNRAFVDSMYDRATTVVDMSQFLALLREQGTIERVFDSRYTEWTKRWNEIPPTMSMPSIYPIRLGHAPPSWDHTPTHDFAYVPLDMVADEIRVLVIPGGSPSDLISTHIAHCPIRCEVTFFALSYTWGESQPLSEVVINGQRKLVRKNLELALQALGSPDSIAVLWIDAVCINQEDILERNRQLVRMSEIYNCAAGVFCYVGESTEDSGLALDSIKYFQEPMMRFDEHGDWVVGTYLKTRLGPADVHQICAALYRFLLRAYFRRIWVLQEVAVASIPTIVCGDRHEINFEKLDTAAYNLQDMLERDPELAAHMQKACPELKKVEISTKELYYVRKLFYFRHLRKKGNPERLYGATYKDFKETAPGYLETAILARDFQATVPHDKVFALWNLAQDKGELDFKMDYSQSIAVTYASFTEAWTKHSGSLDMIGAAEHGSASTFYESAPSWCPDWSVPSRVSSLIRKERIRRTMMTIQTDMDGPLYFADGGVKQAKNDDSFFEFEDNTLHSLGIILDSIAGSFIPSSDDEPDTNPMTNLHGYTTVLSEYFTSNNITTTYHDPLQAAWAMMHGDVPTTWPDRPSNPDNADDDYPNEAYVCMPSRSRHTPRYARTYSREEALDAVDMVLRGRVAFVTANGYMGLGPGSVLRHQSNDTPYLLAVLATCSVPVLLQEQDGGTYMFLGTCFVQGWMEGEILTRFEGVDTPADFWAALRGMEKLRIV